jgi:hypothetical protein
MRLATSDRYYEEVREGQIIPEDSRSQPGMLIGVGPGLNGLPTIYLPGTGVKIALATALFSWFRGGAARAMDHLGELRQVIIWH